MLIQLRTGSAAGIDQALSARLRELSRDRFRSVVVGGMGSGEWGTEGRSFWTELSGKGKDEYMAVMASGSGPRWTPELEAVCRANDLDALAALASAQWPSVEDILPTMTVPCLIFVGEDDSSYAGAKRAAGIMPNATFVGLPGLDHIETAYRNDLVLPHVCRFLADVDEE